MQQHPHTDGPLAGIRVIELGSFIAAASATRILAEFGAEVIKIEPPEGGDELRSWRLYDADTSMLFRWIARNKRSVTLDLRTPEGQALARRLTDDADVVIENFRPGTLERWHLDPTICAPPTLASSSSGSPASGRPAPIVSTPGSVGSPRRWPGCATSPATPASPPSASA